MIARITIGFVAAATLTGCLPPAAAPAPRPLKPQDGPRGSVYVDVLGGAFTRRIQTSFRLDRAGYVLVGHLGGDGRISVLYPETPWSSGWVSGGRTMRLKPQSAVYDAAPHMFSFAVAPFRGLSAEMDSYDGRGHGYVFMITSRYPIDYGAFSDRTGFETLQIEDYERSHDPRYAVRNLADEIATGPYSLKFARTVGGAAFATAMGCPRPWGMRYSSYQDYTHWMGYSYFIYPGSSLLNGIAFARLHELQSCGGGLYASGWGFRTYGVTTVTPVAGTPQGPLTPRLQRPERRTLTNPERTAIVGGRSAIDRGNVISTRRTFDGRSSRPFIDRPGPGSTSSGNHHTVERASRPVNAPRLTTPATPTTTTSSSSSGETKADRPRPQP